VTWQLTHRNNGTRINYPLVSNGSINTHRRNGYARDNRELLEAVSSMRSVPRIYSEGRLDRERYKRSVRLPEQSMCKIMSLFL
jgi:hypothetical protein